MSLAYNISAYNRERKWRRFLREFNITPDLKILDVGFSEREYSATDNYLEKHYPYLGQVTAVGIDHAEEFKQRYPAVRAVTYDGQTLPFSDGQFDIVWSNAVLEHVGDAAAQVQFLKELCRVGQRGFITTPNKLFPFEIHTRIPLLHYLPKPYFDWILRKIGKGWAAGDYMRLLSERELRQMLSRANITNYRIIKNRLVGFTLDFVVVF